MKLFEAPIALDVGASFQAKIWNRFAVIIQSGAYPHMNPKHNGRLLVLDLDALPARHVVGTLEGIGSARQLCICDGIAYITAREDGLFVVDLRSPQTPTILAHYNTLEYATGIAVAKGIAVVSLRQYGLELIDVRDPAKPKYISVVRTGEAQSVCMDGHFLYVGVWGTKELVIVDVLDAANPRIAARAALDGRGDGLIVRDGICYAATGHHARVPKGANEADYHGFGNGLELFDVRDPYHPLHCSTLKFPRYYGLTFDMWDVKLAGDLALISNTRNGIYAVNVKDPFHPVLLDCLRLPVSGETGNEPITGFDFAGNVLILSGGDRDSWFVPLAQTLPAQYRSQAQIEIPHPPQALSMRAILGTCPPWKAALPGTFVRMAQAVEEKLYCACDSSGVLVLHRKSLEVLAEIPTQGAAFALAVRGEYLYVAEGTAGFCTYRLDGEKFEQTARYSPWGRSVMDLQFSGDGRMVLLQVASNGVAALDVQNPSAPSLLWTDVGFVGLFYGRHFPSHGLGENCFFAVNCEGCFAASPDGKTRQLAKPLPVGPGSGLEVWRNRLLAVRTDAYCMMDPDADGMSDPEWRPLQGIAGKPRIFGNLLVATERAEGKIALCRMHADGSISVETILETTASPDLACITDDAIYLPGGRQGLLILEGSNVS